MKAKTLPRGPCGSMPWRALVLAAALAMVATASGTVAQAAPRDVTGNVVFQMMDYENFGKNERCRHDIRIDNKINESPWRYEKYWYFGKCGGEIRAEIHYDILRDRNSLVDVKGDVRFFEGTSANTDDLDGMAWFSLEVPQGRTGTESIHVENWREEQPDDKADVTLTVHN